jgi:hypothetical protein
VQAELEKLGRGLPDGEALAAKAREWLDKCKVHRKNGEFTEACADAEVALQSTRLLMRAHWEQAVRGLTSAVSSPYAVSFYTLPRHYKFVEEVRRLRPEGNALPGGDFEESPAEKSNWLIEEVPSLDQVEVSAKRIADGPHGGKQCLKLQVTPKQPQLAPLALERTFIAIHSPAVRLAPGTPVRISAWVRIPAPIKGSTDGALLYDSAGGEPLAIRLTGASKGWEQLTLYRRVPASGTVNVTMALTGMGTAYFDDVKVEPLTAGEASGTVANRPGPQTR